MILLVSLSIFFATLCNAQNPGGYCTTTCSDKPDPEPICARASYPTEYREFPNDCQYWKHHCIERRRGREWKKVYTTPCSEPQQTSYQSGDQPRPNPHQHQNPHQFQHGHQPQNPHQFQHGHQPQNPHQFQHGHQPQNPHQFQHGHQPQLQTDCPAACPLSNNLEPVCASNNHVTRMFINECLVRAEECATGPQQTWRRVQLGACSDSNKYSPRYPQSRPYYTQPSPSEHQNQNTINRCRVLQPCNRVSPVCALSDGQHHTFNSECAMEIAKCENPTKTYTQVHLDNCTKSQSSPQPAGRTMSKEEKDAVQQAEQTQQRTNQPSQQLTGGQTSQQQGEPNKEYGKSGFQPSQRYREQVISNSEQTQQHTNQPSQQLTGGQTSQQQGGHNYQHNYQHGNQPNPQNRVQPNYQHKQPSVHPSQQQSGRTYNVEQPASQQQAVQLPASECPICPRISSRPVCAQSGQESQTFASSCSLEKAQCNSPTRAWKQLHEGECQRNKWEKQEWVY